MESLSAKMKKTSLMPRWWKKRFTAVITETDPSCKVVYLGNVLTGWAKGNLSTHVTLFLLFHSFFVSIGSQLIRARKVFLHNKIGVV